MEKAHQYRLLTEASEAESICLDILRVDKNNPEALRMLLLSMTDKFERNTVAAVKVACDLLPRFDDYGKVYYEGIICERWAKAVLKQHRPRYQYVAWEWLQRALAAFDKATKLAPQGNENATLRWNTCMRILRAHPEVGPEPEGESEPQLLE